MPPAPADGFDPAEWMSVAEAVRVLGSSRQNVNEMLRAGTLGGIPPEVNGTRWWLVNRAEVETRAVGRRSFRSSPARDALDDRRQAELEMAQGAERSAQNRAHAAALAERDSRIAALERELADLSAAYSAVRHEYAAFLVARAATLASPAPPDSA